VTAPRQRVEVALIARDAAATIGATLASLRPFASRVVVVVDDRTSDKTEAVCRRASRKGFAVETVRRTWSDHFGEARQASFDLLDKDADWWLWVDADDVVQGAEKVQEMLAPLAERPDIGVIWLYYEYSHDETGRCTTRFARERFVRPGVGWTWRERVHEHLVGAVPVVQTRGPEDVRIVHQHIARAGNSRRNLDLLLKVIGEDPPGSYDRPRTLRELGEAHLALNEPRPAVEWFLRAIEEQTEDVDRWWCWLKISEASRRLQDWGAAEEAGLNAFRLHPEWAEASLELAYTAEGRQDWNRALAHALRVPSCQPTPDLIFRCPLDYTHHWRYLAAHALGNQARVDEALKVMWPVRNTDHRTRKDCRTLVKAMRLRKAAQASVVRAGQTIDHLVGQPIDHPAIGSDLWGETAVRDAWVPHLLKARRAADVTVFCGHAPEEWAPPSLAKGIGGSETAVIEIARRFAAEGRRVDVYGNPGVQEGEHAGVGYWDARRYDPKRATEVFVAWRRPDALSFAPPSRTRLLWMHDLNQGRLLTEEARGFDRVLGVSAWHGSYLRRCYPFLDPERVGFVPNGINLERFAGEEERAVHRLVWSSSPDRGLEQVLALWPRLKRRVDDAELHVFYGWEGVDRAIRAGRTDLAAFKEAISTAVERLPGVEWRGRVGQDELAREQMRADVWAYPTTFVETSCISAMEMQAAGTVPVTSALGALPEAVGDAGVCLPGHPTSPTFHTQFLGLTFAALLDIEMRVGWQARGKYRAQGFTWDRAFETWRGILEPAREEEHEAVAA
jgi:glycosyltransferase involved in cell wall biosynthesis